MHSFEVKILIPEDYYNELLKIPMMKRVSSRVCRSNYYSKKGIKQIELRTFSYYREVFGNGKINKVEVIIYYLVFRCNANQIVGGNPLFALDMKKYDKQDILDSLSKRIYEIPEFQNLKLLHINASYMTTDRADIAYDVFIDIPSLYVYLCNMGFPYRYYNMVRKQINKSKEILYFESCYFLSKSRTVNIYFKRAAILNTGGTIEGNMQEILSKMLRIEIQIKRQGVKNLSRKKKNGRQFSNFLNSQFVENYLQKEIGNIFRHEKYVSHSKAKDVINNSSYSAKEKKILLSILEMVNTIGLYDLEEAITNEKPYNPKPYGVIRYFKAKWLKIFKLLQISPVTIPDEYGIDELPSLYQVLTIIA